MKWIEDGFVLSSGRKVDANYCIVGLAPDGHPSTGYDDGIDMEFHPWTPEERQELAREMIRLWRRFADEGLPPE